MRSLSTALMVVVVGLGCDVRVSTAREHEKRRALPARAVKPQLALDDIGSSALCVTKGALSGARVEAPTFRAVAPGHRGDAASIKFVVRGPTATTRALAHGSNRRQLGLKLRAKDGCNLLYVMWQLDPDPKLVVDIKRNPGARTHRDCGANGYSRIEPISVGKLPSIEYGAEHELRAEIVEDKLVAWIDNHVMWSGALPTEAHELSGPSGVRSDNLDFELAAVAVDARGGGKVDAKCRGIDDPESD